MKEIFHLMKHSFFIFLIKIRFNSNPEHFVFSIRGNKNKIFESFNRSFFTKSLRRIFFVFWSIEYTSILCFVLIKLYRTGRLLDRTSSFTGRTNSRDNVRFYHKFSEATARHIPEKHMLCGRRYDIFSADGSISQNGNICLTWMPIATENLVIHFPYNFVTFPSFDYPFSKILHFSFLFLHKIEKKKYKKYQRR